MVPVNMELAFSARKFLQCSFRHVEWLVATARAQCLRCGLSSEHASTMTALEWGITALILMFVAASF